MKHCAQQGLEICARVLRKIVSMNKKFEPAEKLGAFGRGSTATTENSKFSTAGVNGVAVRSRRRH